MLSIGEMAERLIAPVLKTGVVLQTTEGSNPSLSVFKTIKDFKLKFQYENIHIINILSINILSMKHYILTIKKELNQRKKNKYEQEIHK